MKRNVWRHRVWIACALSVGTLTFGSSRAEAHGHLARWFGWGPTYYVRPIPTAYVVPSSYLVATSFAYSPAVVATSYYVDTAVVPTSYMSSGCDCDAPVATSYLPSVAYAPRAYDVVSNPSCAPCATSSAPAYTPSNSYIAPSEPAPTKYAPRRVEPAPKPEIESEPVNPPNPTAAQPTNPMSKRENTLPSRGPAAAADPVDSGTISPPNAPADDKDLGRTPLSPPAPAPDGKPPVAPGGEIELQPEPTEGVKQRDAFKPVSPTKPFVRTAMRKNLNVLQGVVVSGDSAQPEEGVRLSFVNRSGGAIEKEAVSDAFGKYAVRLADGEWTVKVTMPSGRVYSVSQLTVENGKITDELGRDIPTLNITR